MGARSGVAACALLFTLTFATVGCAGIEDSAPHDRQTAVDVAAKTGDGSIRTDLDPVAQRYSQLAVAESVVWMSGTMGTSDLGPSTYWMDIVAVMPPSEMEALLALDDLTEVSAMTLVDGMVKNMPSGPFLGSPALDALFSANGANATVALDAKTRTVVLSGVFE